MNFLEHVPKGFELRPEQKYILEHIGDNWEDYDTFIIEAPVGVGKSLVAMTIGNALRSAHVLTPKISLQSQYHNAFPDIASVVMGRKNYPCLYEKPELTKSVVARIKKGEPPAKFFGMTCASEKRHCASSYAAKMECQEKTGTLCPFDLAIEVAQESPVVIHNMAGFVYHATLHGKFDRRKCLIVDEAHSLIDVLRSTAAYSVILSPKEAEFFKLGDEPCTDLSKVREGLKMVNQYREPLEKAPTPPFSVERGFATLVSLDHDRTELTVVNTGFGSHFNPFIRPFGEKQILMTGSLGGLDAFCQWLGLKKDEIYVVTISKSPFPVRNRRIVVPTTRTVSMKAEERKKNFPKLVKTIEEILEAHSEDRGVIHVNSYEMVRDLKEAIKNPRLLAPVRSDEHGFLYHRFVTDGAKDAVFVSPGIAEGVDLKDDLARFQIIASLAFPPNKGLLNSLIFTDDLGRKNEALKIREMYRQVAIKLIQQVGRVVRHHEDFGVTYILDSRIGPVLKRSWGTDLFPEWFYEAIVAQLEEKQKGVGFKDWLPFIRS